jgi:hypothetical protein
VLLIGDSGTWDMAPAFNAGFKAAGIPFQSIAFPGVGLTTPTGIRQGWYARAAWMQADYVIIGIGTWDDAFIAEHGWAAYQAEIDDTVHALTQNGAHLLWMSVMPSDAAEPDAHAKPTVQDRLYSFLPARYPGQVEYFDIGPALRAPGGTTPRTIDGRLLRKPDGWHLCPDGAAAIVHLVLQHLDLDRTTWEHGPWRHNPLYDNPRGGCPNSGR